MINETLTCDEVRNWIAENEELPVNQCNIPEEATFMVVRNKNYEIVAVGTVRHVTQVQMTFLRKGSIFQSLRSFQELRGRCRSFGTSVWTLVSKNSPLYAMSIRMMRRLPGTHELFFPLERGESHVHRN